MPKTNRKTYMDKWRQRNSQHVLDYSRTYYHSHKESNRANVVCHQCGKKFLGTLNQVARFAVGKRVFCPTGGCRGLYQKSQKRTYGKRICVSCSSPFTAKSGSQKACQSCRDFVAAERARIHGTELYYQKHAEKLSQMAEYRRRNPDVFRRNTVIRREQRAAERLGSLATTLNKIGSKMENN